MARSFRKNDLVMKQSGPVPQTEVQTPQWQASGASGLIVELWCAVRPWAARLAWALMGCWLLICCGIKYWAESNLLTVFLAYVPVWVVALPLLGCMVLAVFFGCWRLAFGACCFAGVCVVCLGGWAARNGEQLPPSDEPTLTVMTYNRGQGATTLLGQLQTGIVADLCVFQDAARRRDQIAALPAFAAYPHRHQTGEFVLLSRWPVLDSTLLNLEWSETPGKPYAAGCRSVVNWNGRPIVVYNVHLPTPRDLLYWYGQRGTFLYGLLGLVPGTPLARRHVAYLRPWRARLGAVDQIVSRLREEKAPVILLGDLNLPPVGEAYRKLCEELQDAHTLAGRGFGHTFPGDIKSPVRLVAPWIRIDYVFVSNAWGGVSCHVVPLHKSQHLPLAATIYLRHKPKNTW